jgi:multidrug efflux pump
VLAALYESWSLPLAVILVVPMCVLSSIAGVALGMLGARTGYWQGITDINIFTQVGFVVLIGLACKNAILIVEFAKLRRDAGEDATSAILAACRLRLRPIMMTSFAFILGVVPLVIATGAGWEMRRALGTAVFSGMLGVTFFGLFLTPVFFYVIDRLAHWPVFSTGYAPALGQAALAALSLRPVRELARQSWSRMKNTAGKRAKPARPPASAPPHTPALPPAEEPVPVAGGDRSRRSPDAS